MPLIAGTPMLRPTTGKSTASTMSCLAFFCSASSLSLGERKIIILFTIAVFSEELIVLLDEPEASLSIVWQEQLIMDIIENTNYKNLIVATQSPYVIENESLDEYIIPLIDGEYDE